MYHRHRLRLLLFGPLACVAFTAAGQHHALGIAVGTSYARFRSGDSRFDADEPRRGLVAGLTYEYRPGPHLRVGADLLFSQRGYEGKLVFRDRAGLPTGRELRLPARYDYVALPLKAGVAVGRRLTGAARLGISPALLVRATVTDADFDAAGNLVGTKAVSASGCVHRLDLSGLVELAGGYALTQDLTLALVAGYQHSLLSIARPGCFGTGVWHEGATVTLGLQRGF